MNRRSFLSFAGAGALAARSPWISIRHAFAAGRPPGLRLSLTWGIVGKRSVADGLALIHRHGYDGFEMFDWRNASILAAFAEEKKKYPLECVCLVANKGVTAPGCGLVNPREREGFLEQMQLAVNAAKRVDCKRLVVLTGNELGGLSREEQMSNAASALRAAVPLLEKNGMTAVVEVLNTYVDHAGYFLYYVRDGAALVDRVGSPNVRILFDLYHTQIMEGNLIEKIRMFIGYVGHFHFADVPGRHEPGTGEINYRNVFKAIYDLGDRYPGYVSLEYGPLAPVEENLAAVRKLTQF
ncbi:MAG: TIM barrel protein [Acidobacteria bacterium]|nr:TIM barrel protein [Acidobacteriota bacterium]